MGQWFGCNAEPVSGNGSSSGGYSYIPNETAPVAGFITKIEIWVSDESGGVFHFGVMENTSSNNWLDEHYVNSLAISNGLNQYEAPADFALDALPIDVGQGIGVWLSSSAIWRKITSGGPGYLYDNGQHVGVGDTTGFATSGNSTHEMQVRVWIQTGDQWEDDVEDGLKMGDSVIETYIPGFPGIVWGEETPGGTLSGVSWTTWQKSTGATEQVLGDLDWGKLNTYDFAHVSNVHDTEISNLAQDWTFRIETDFYEAGTSSGTIYIRGHADTFAWDAGTPSWEETTITGTHTEAWRYIQLKVEHTA